jgi:hypothetical protein
MLLLHDSDMVYAPVHATFLAWLQMTEERLIDYDALLHEAFRDAQRGVMRSILSKVAESGLPGDHHFYISFNTLAPGVSIAPRLLQKYPTEMTIVLQHRFWDLIVQADRFEVKLTFDSIRERLVIPFSAVRMFFDPSVPYGLQFEEATDGRPGSPAESRTGEIMGFGGGRGGTRMGPKSATERKKSTRKTKIDAVSEAPAAETAAEPKPPRLAPQAAKPADEATQDATAVPPAKSGPRLVETTANDSAKVVSLDQFRKK